MSASRPMKYKFHTKPYRHQRKGLVRLWKKGGGALFWEPGTGKTKTALDFIAALYLAGKAQRILVLCPINALQVWPAQLEEHFGITYSILIPEGKIADKAEQIIPPESDYPDFIILNYDAIIKRDKKWQIMKALEAYRPDVLVLDESQKVKNATAKRSKAAHHLGQITKYKVLMTGTPISKNYLDLYSQLKVLDQEIWRHPHKPKIMSWTEFRYRYGIWGGRSGYELRGYVNVEDLMTRYKPWVSTARKRSCLDLPKATDVIVPVEMNARAKEAYNFFSEEGLVVWRRHMVEAPIVLTKLLRLQEMTGGFVHDEVGKVVEFQRDKVTVLKGLVEDLIEAEEKVVIFARFRAEMDAIVHEMNGKIYQIRGGVSAAQRKKVVRDFIQRKDLNPLLIQIAAGEALDGLQHVCSNAIFYSTDFSWDHYSQARGRLERSGQKDPITFWHLHMRGTVDKMVHKALQEKKDLERMVMDDPDLLVAAVD